MPTAPVPPIINGTVNFRAVSGLVSMSEYRQTSGSPNERLWDDKYAPGGAYKSLKVSITKEDVVEGLRRTADVIEFLAPGIRNIPPAYIFAAGGLVGIVGLPAAAVVIGIYAESRWAPGQLRWAADTLDRWNGY